MTTPTTFDAYDSGFRAGPGPTPRIARLGVLAPLLLLLAAAVFVPLYGVDAHGSGWRGTAGVPALPGLTGARAADGGVSGPHPFNGSGNHSGNGTGHHGANVTLNATNGTLSIGVALYYAAVSGGFSVNGSISVLGGTGPYALNWSWGNGGTGTSSGNSTGTRTWIYNVYTASGNYTFAASVLDANRTFVQVSTVISVLLPAPGLSLSLSWGDVLVNGTPSTQVNATIQNGVPPYGLSVLFGDGASFGQSNISGPNTTVRVDHTYGPFHNQTQFFVTASCSDSANGSARAYTIVTPSYLHHGGGNGSNNSSGVRGVQSGSLTLSNGSLVLNLSYQLVDYTGWGNLTAWGNVTGGSPPYRVVFQPGDGYSANLSLPGGSNGSRPVSFGFQHPYTSAGTFAFSLSVDDSGGLVVLATQTFTVPGTNSSGSRGVQSGSLTLSNGSLVLNLSYVLVTYTGWGNLTTWGNVTGGTQPYQVGFAPGDGVVVNQTLSGGPNGTGRAAFSFNHQYTSAGTFPFSLSVADSAGLYVLATQSFTVPGPGGNGSGNHTAYPSLVSVAIDASPVSGPAPLNVTLSALISGGSPPFTVDWSLPGSSPHPNLTGVEVLTSYPTAGWYPATAFVYNTTTSFGTVLVGFWSVWIDVTAGSSGGNHSGNNSGNGSGNHSGHLQPPTSGTLSTTGGTAANMLFTAFLVALTLGGLVGAFVGYVFGAGRRRPPRSEPLAVLGPPGRPPDG